MELKACTHHWNIEIANGPNSSGSCLKCGRTQMFDNSIREKQAITQIDVPREPIEGQDKPAMSLLAPKSKGRPKKRGPGINL